MYARFQMGVIASIIALLLLVPLFAHAQSSVESRIASLVQQLVSIQNQLLELLRANPSQDTSIPNFPLTNILTPSVQSPDGIFRGGSVSSQILNAIGPIIRTDAGYVAHDLLPTTTVRTTARPAGPTCTFYGQFFPEGSTRAGSACPGSSCPDIAAPMLTCKGGEWRYSTGESICVPPGFILDTPVQREYREALGCRATSNLGISCSDSRYPCPFRSGVTGHLTCVAQTLQGSCPSIQSF